MSCITTYKCALPPRSISRDLEWSLNPRSRFTWSWCVTQLVEVIAGYAFGFHELEESSIDKFSYTAFGESEQLLLWCSTILIKTRVVQICRRAPAGGQMPVTVNVLDVVRVIVLSFDRRPRIFTGRRFFLAAIPLFIKWFHKKPQRANSTVSW